MNVIYIAVNIDYPLRAANLLFALHRTLVSEYVQCLSLERIPYLLSTRKFEPFANNNELFDHSNSKGVVLYGTFKPSVEFVLICFEHIST